MRHLVLVSLLLLIAVPALAQQYPMSPWQWQPQLIENGFDLDRRLEQPVTIEIMGRSAVSALKLLAEKTGVDLSVSPESLLTLGERKVTVIAKDCSLKTIMVQIPHSLQECHWLIDTRGTQPVYQLHRNAGVGATMKWLTEKNVPGAAKRIRESRLARMEEARQALTMTPEELAELEKTDLLMARTMRDPYARNLVEALLSLPPQQEEQLRDTGQVSLAYAQASPTLQKAVQQMGEWQRAAIAAKYPNAPNDPTWREHLPGSSLIFQDMNTDHGFGIYLKVDWEGDVEGRGMGNLFDTALQPRFASLDDGESRFVRLLVATGTSDEKTAYGIVEGLDHAGFRHDDVKREERRKKEWIEPTDPALLQTVKLGDRQFADFAEIQEFISDQTGLSVVSDYFTLRRFYLRDEARAGLPLWRLLYSLGEDDFWGDVYLWRKAGNLLIFQRADWYALAPKELPESLITEYREKLRAQGEFTLDDLAELAVILNSRGLTEPTWPKDLTSAHIQLANGWALRFYASLSPDQRVKVRSAAGLSYADMTIAQRREVADRGAAGRPVVPENEATWAVFSLAERTEGSGTQHSAFTQLELRFPGRTDVALVGFRRSETPEPRAK